jgi:hypothetical protein
VSIAVGGPGTGPVGFAGPRQRHLHAPRAMAPAKSRTGSSPEGTNGLLAAAMLSGATGGIGEIFDCLPISAAAAAAQGLPKHAPGHQPSQLSGDGSFPSALPATASAHAAGLKPWCSQEVMRALDAGVDEIHDALAAP